MSDPRRAVESAFDARAATYTENDWHVHYAEHLVSLAEPAPGMHVLDAACGTGFATLPIAGAVTPTGRVVGVDISAGMLAHAREALAVAGLTNVELVKGDATSLLQFADGAFDQVICSAGLLYLPVRPALREWNRLLAKGGLVGFSTMRAGFPFAARLFRELAEAHGLPLADPASPLGTEEHCRQVLREAGFEPRVVAGTIEFTPQDLAYAWEGHIRGPHHDQIHALDPLALREFEQAYRAAIARYLRDDPERIRTAEVLYAFGRKADAPTS